MDLYPAIDLREGKCVRLYQGDYAQQTVYHDNPADQARVFAEAGASWIHVVDLDAARSGNAANLDAIAAICSAVDVPVQCGGGVRSLDAADRLRKIGVARVVIGTAAVERPELVEEVGAVMPVAVGLDARGTDIATHGWERASGVDLLESAQRFGAIADALVVTEISVDGTMAGPSIDQLRKVLEAVGNGRAHVIASGGIGNLDHLIALAEVLVSGRTLGGAILGRALYERTVSLSEAVTAVQS